MTLRVSFHMTLERPRMMGITTHILSTRKSPFRKVQSNLTEYKKRYRSHALPDTE